MKTTRTKSQRSPDLAGVRRMLKRASSRISAIENTFADTDEETELGMMLSALRTAVYAAELYADGDAEAKDTESLALQLDAKVDAA